MVEREDIFPEYGFDIPVDRGPLWAKLRRGLGCAAAGAVLGFGVTNAVGVETDMAGFSFDTSVSVGTGIVADFGPLGKVRDNAGLPLNSGVVVKVEDAPIDDEGQAALSAALGDVHASLEHLRDRTLLGLLRGAEQGAYAGFLFGCFVDKKRARALRYIALGALVTGVVPTSVKMATQNWRHPTKVIEGFDTSGIEVAGAGPNYILDKIEENEGFYNTAASNMTKTLATVAAQANARNQDIYILETDWHCRTGTARVLGAALTVTKAKGLISGGDDTTSGEKVESICIDIYNRYVPKTVKTKIGVLGNHDSTDTGQEMTDHGFIIMNAGPVDAAGLTWMGFSDPRRNVIGRPQSLRDPNETIPQYIARVNKAICDQPTPPDVVVIHDLSMVKDAIENGCALNFLGGHQHRRIGPDVTDKGVMTYTAAQSGGSVEDTPSVLGPLDTDATLTLLFVNRDNKVLEGIQVVETATDATTSTEGYLPIDNREVLDDPRMQRIETMLAAA